MVNFQHPEISAVGAQWDVETGYTPMILENRGIAIDFFGGVSRENPAES